MSHTLVASLLHYLGLLQVYVSQYTKKLDVTRAIRDSLAFPYIYHLIDRTKGS